MESGLSLQPSLYRKPDVNVLLQLYTSCCMVADKTLSKNEATVSL